MNYTKCGGCEFMYKNEALQADCACLNYDDLPEQCPLKDGESQAAEGKGG